MLTETISTCEKHINQETCFDGCPFNDFGTCYFLKSPVNWNEADIENRLKLVKDNNK